MTLLINKLDRNFLPNSYVMSHILYHISYMVKVKSHPDLTSNLYLLPYFCHPELDQPYLDLLKLF